MSNKIDKKLTSGGITRLVLIISIVVLTGSIAAKNISGNAGGTPAGGPKGKPGMGRTELPQGGESVFSVNIGNPERMDIIEILKVNGDITTENSVEIYADTSGTLVSRIVSIGDYVSRDDVIARVDPSKPGTVYEASPVESTITGTVTRLPGSIGDTVTTASSIATIGDLKNLQIQAFIPEKEITWIKPGLTGEAELAPYPGEYISVSIIEVSPVLDSTSRTMEVKLIATDEKSGKMKAGMFASVRIFTRISENVLSVSVDSVLTDENDSFVYVVNQDKAELRYVETGLRSDSRVEILSGLAESDHVIVRGQSLITEGSSVKVIGESE
jgi:multidrug efflux pump subunit AcrA (membrane-fusion protein)